MSGRTILAVEGLTRDFGGIRALSDVSFSLAKDHVTAMIGPNGAGKTTFINVLMGVHPPTAGRAQFEGREIAALPPHEKAALGIARTFQLEELFGTMTVIENALVGCHTKSRRGLLSTGLRLPAALREERRLRENALENLRKVGIADRAELPVTKLPLGERKLVGIARALGMNPKLLMLDEPAGGLAAHEVDRLADLIRELVAKGIAVFLIEHNMPFVMSLADRVVVLNAGRKIADGTPDEVRANEEVIKAYLGEDR